MNYMLDTTAYSQLLRGHPVVARAVKAAETIYIPQVVVAELRYGFQLGTRTTENEQLLSRFLASKKVKLLMADNAATDYFVEVAVHAKNKAVKLSSHDLWIAAQAVQWGAKLLTFDRDFQQLGYSRLRLKFCTQD